VSISGFAVANEIAKCFGSLSNEFLYDFVIFYNSLHSVSKAHMFLSTYTMRAYGVSC